MKITCDRQRLLTAFQTVASAVPGRSPKPILHNVKIAAEAGIVTLSATDLEIGIAAEIRGVECEPGSALLPAARVLSILRESSDEQLTIVAAGHRIVITGERSEFTFPSESPQEFPEITAPDAGEPYYLLDGQQLRSLIRRTIYATDSESSRYALGGVFLDTEAEKITGVGCDGRRIATAEIATIGHEGEPWKIGNPIVPCKALQLVEKAIVGDQACRLTIRGTAVLFDLGSVRLYSRLVEGRFPKWRDVFPPAASRKAVIEMPTAPLHAALRQAAITTSDESRGVDFEFQSGSLVLSGRAPELGDCRIELPIEYVGQAIGITLDPRYVAEFIKASDCEEITITLKDAESAAVLASGHGYAGVIMPLARDR